MRGDGLSSFVDTRNVDPCLMHWRMNHHVSFMKFKLPVVCVCVFVCVLGERVSESERMREGEEERKWEKRFGFGSKF